MEGEHIDCGTLASRRPSTTPYTSLGKEDVLVVFIITVLCILWLWAETDSATQQLGNIAEY